MTDGDSQSRLGLSPASIAKRAHWLDLALLATLLLLLAHAAEYAFVTDDAYISFRYARNLAHGHGLVFNPGYERVEGYTNFLWVVLLAAGGLSSIGPDQLANPMSLLATVGLWGLTAWFARRSFARSFAAPALAWTALVPPLLLAATRSVAVWSTSGLETRLFELLALGAVLRTVVELEDTLTGRRPRPWSGVLFALSTLTRPDGALIAVSTLGAAALLVVLRKRARVGQLAVQFCAFLAPVTAHEIFRVAYYGEWAPNTYYAKVGGETWWSMGLAYLAMFVLEYGALLWAPLIWVGVRSHARAGRSHLPLLFSAALVPHLIYVASIGGDHFEYRPLGLCFPLLYLLLADGLRELDLPRARRFGRAACMPILLFALTWIPLRSHLTFPRRYLPGFPGVRADWLASSRFLEPERDPLLGLPLLRAIGDAYRWLLLYTTDHFVGLRQEEHALFAANVLEDGEAWRTLVQRGVFPRNLHVGLGCVGVVPYLSDLRVLDLLGLTDRVVAHGPFTPGKRVMAHGKLASPDYLRSAGVEIEVPTIAFARIPLTDHAFAGTLATVDFRKDLWAAKLDADNYLIVRAPLGIERVRARLPKLDFAPLGDPVVRTALALRAIAAHRARRSDALDRWDGLSLAWLWMEAGRPTEALAAMVALLAAQGDDASLWLQASELRRQAGDTAGAIRAAGRALELARRDGDFDMALTALNSQLRRGRERASEHHP